MDNKELIDLLLYAKSRIETSLQDIIDYRNCLSDEKTIERLFLFRSVKSERSAIDSIEKVINELVDRQNKIE